uniref:Inward rectifier potassium channel 2 n=1 Tax=Cacopsylla melanoneura TaxID=428564 RepID=A0A8D8X7M4_9HEMI
MLRNITKLQFIRNPSLWSSFFPRKIRSALRRKLLRRTVAKHGNDHVIQINIAERKSRFLWDIFTTLVEIQWRWTLLLCIMGFVLTWFGIHDGFSLRQAVSSQAAHRNTAILPNSGHQHAGRSAVPHVQGWRFEGEESHYKG